MKGKITFCHSQPSSQKQSERRRAAYWARPHTASRMSATTKPTIEIERITKQKLKLKKVKMPPPCSCPCSLSSCPPPWRPSSGSGSSLQDAPPSQSPFRSASWSPPTKERRTFLKRRGLSAPCNWWPAVGWPRRPPSMSVGSPASQRCTGPRPVGASYKNA